MYLDVSIHFCTIAFLLYSFRISLIVECFELARPSSFHFSTAIVSITNELFFEIRLHVHHSLVTSSRICTQHHKLIVFDRMKQPNCRVFSSLEGRIRTTTIAPQSPHSDSDLYSWNSCTKWFWITCLRRLCLFIPLQYLSLSHLAALSPSALLPPQLSQGIYSIHHHPSLLAFPLFLDFTTSASATSAGATGGGLQIV